jgi:hypothetical protein
MKFSCSIEIEKPITKVIELFENPDSMKEWQDGFVRLDPVSGYVGQVGAKSKLIYKNMELIETVLVRDQNRFKGLYEHTHMVNTMDNRFTSLSETKTRWDVEIDYTKFNGIIPKLMALLMPGLFRRQVEKWLVQFKTFAERS